MLKIAITATVLLGTILSTAGCVVEKTDCQKLQNLLSWRPADPVPHAREVTKQLALMRRHNDERSLWQKYLMECEGVDSK